MKSIVYLSLGSSVEPRFDYLKFAVKSLKAEPFVSNIEISRIYETKPLGDTAKNLFLNAVLKVMVQSKNPHDFLRFLNEIEQKAMRKRILKWGDRTLDIDILMWDSQIINDENLIIPHPELHKRDFVLKPFCDVAPDAEHPVFKKQISDLYSDLISKGSDFVYILNPLNINL